MQFRNTKERFGAVTKTFHWTIALFIACLICLGIYLEDYATTPEKIRLFPVHKEFGICVLMLATARVLWHLYSRPPGSLASLKAWETWGARIAHALLYLAMFVMPLSGWLLSSAAGKSVSFFGLFMLPDLVAKSEELKEFFEEVHGIAGWSLIPLIALHAAGALKHHFIDKDITLRRMLPFGLKDQGENSP
ncbi:MAG: cytochrome b [Alphaproteobacteria bacterium]|nr:MAG: cytochrome b [Alphaproteobacteria bacterium]